MDYGVGVGDSSGRSCCEIRRGGDGHGEEDVDECLSSCELQIPPKPNHLALHLSYGQFFYLAHVFRADELTSTISRLEENVTS